MKQNQQELFTSDLLKFKHRMNWEITLKCNFACPYCPITELQKTPEPEPKSPNEIAFAFNRTQLEWLILITGGEPFLYPNFIDVCLELSKQHFLQITTNLSAENVYEFAEKIQPNRVFNICASYHVGVRTTQKEEEEFINKYNFLKNKGFNVLVNLILIPQNQSQILQQLQKFNSIGIKAFLYAYRGWGNGKFYPESYTENEIEILKSHSVDDTEIKLVLNKHRYYGIRCKAGVNYFAMDRFGNYGRCFTLGKKLGNFFNDGINISKKAKPCIAENCNDYYHVTLTKKASKFAINKEQKQYNRLKGFIG